MEKLFNTFCSQHNLLSDLSRMAAAHLIPFDHIVRQLQSAINFNLIKISTHPIGQRKAPSRLVMFWPCWLILCQLVASIIESGRSSPELCIHGGTLGTINLTPICSLSHWHSC